MYLVVNILSHKIRCAKNRFQALNLVKIAKAYQGGLQHPPWTPAEFRKTQSFCKTVVDKSAWEYPWLVILPKGFLKLLNLFMLRKQESTTCQKLGSLKVNQLYLLYLMVLRCCFLHLIKQNCNLKLNGIPVTPKLVRKVITDINFSKASGPDCIPVVVLKKCEPELSYIPAEFFNMCLKKSCFPNSCRVSSVVLVSKNAVERYTAKNLVGVLSVVTKIFEKLVNSRLVDHLQKKTFFWFPVYFQIFSINYRSSGSCIW